MDESVLCDLSSLFDSNIYAEIETNDQSPAAASTIEDKNMCRMAILAAFDDFEEKTPDFSDCVLSKSSSENELASNFEKVLYENSCGKVIECKDDGSEESAGASQTRSGKIFSMIGKSIKGKLKMSSADDRDPEKFAEGQDSAGFAAQSLGARLKEKLKTGVKFSILKHLQSSVSKRGQYGGMSMFTKIAVFAHHRRFEPIGFSFRAHLFPSHSRIAHSHRSPTRRRRNRETAAETRVCVVVRSSFPNFLDAAPCVHSRRKFYIFRLSRAIERSVVNERQ